VQWLHGHLVNNPQEMLVKSTMSVRLTALTLAAVVTFSPDSAAAQRGTYSSRSHGPTFGVSLAGVGLSTRRGADDDLKTEFTGAGVQMEIGWHMLDSHFGLLVDYTNVNIDENGPPNVRQYNHLAGLGRYIFRSDRDIARPYVELGINRREVIARTPGPDPRNARAQSIGGALGGGVQLFMARAVAVDLGAQVGLGGFNDWESGDDIITSLPELTQSTAVVRLGVRFWPGR
jgi:hypothetical protein